MNFRAELIGLIDFTYNDEYLGAIAGRTNYIFDYTKKFVPPPHSDASTNEQNSDLSASPIIEL